MGSSISFYADDDNIMYLIDEFLKEKKWSIPMICKPIGLRITVSLDNSESLKTQFINDLKSALKFANENKNKIVKSFNKQLYGTLIKVPNQDFKNKIIGKFFIEMNKFN